MGFLRDSDAAQIEELLKRGRGSDPRLAGWAERLIEDRKARTALIHQLTRQLHHARRRLQQAARYLDSLLKGAYDAGRAPWPDKQPCPQCGAPVAQVLSDSRPQGGHVLVHTHVDGVRCQPAPDGQAGGGPPRPAATPPRPHAPADAHDPRRAQPRKP